MKELDELDSNLEMITKTICSVHETDDDTTQLYLEVARRCTKHFKAFVTDPQYVHVAEILKESEHAAVLVDLTNLLNIVLHGHILVSKARVMSNADYHQWFFNLMVAITGIFYQFGYTDGSKTTVPDAFSDFVSSLDIDDE